MRWTRAFVLALVTVPGVGCALFDKKTWDLDQYRDQRAVDVDQRLSDSKPIVESPF